MAVPVKDSVKINFGGGLNTKDDPKQIDASEFLVLNNMTFSTGGGLTKRSGFAGGYTKTVTTPNPTLTFSAVPATLTAATKIFSYNNELLLNDAWSLYSWDVANSSWIYKGRSTRVALSAASVMANGALTFRACDSSIDTTTGIKIFVGSLNDGVHAYYSIQDTTTGQFIVNQASLGGYNYVRCISIPGKSWIFGVNSGNGQIDFLAITGQTPAGSITTGWITNLNATNQFYDVDVDPNTGNIYVAWYTSGGAISIAAVSSTLVIGNTITKAGETATHGLSWFPDGTNIWACYANVADVKIFVVNNAVSATTVAPTSIDGAPGVNVNNVTGCWSSTQNKAFVFYDKVTLSGGANSPVATASISYNTVTSGGAGGTPTLFCGDVCINSKAFVTNGIPHITALYAVYIVEATNFLLNLYNVTPTMGGSSNNDVTANIAAKYSADEAAQTCLAGGKNGGSGSLPGVHQNSAGAWELASLQNNNYGDVAIFYVAPTAIMDVQFVFSATNPDVQTLGNNTAIAGGSVLNYDSAVINEQNFHIYPRPIDQSAGIATGGGGTHMGLASADSLYSYIFVYEWIDNQGQIHRSFPSPVMTPIASGHAYTFASGTTDGVITLTVPMLRVTNKSGTQVVVNIYRTVANGSVYFQVTPSFGTVINDPTVATKTYADNFSDSLIIGNIQLYTTGELGYYAPPSSSALTNFKNRGIQVSSENPFQIGYSNAVLQNFPVQFVPEFLQNIGTVGGALITVAQMDDKLILFKNGKISGPAIYYMVGNGPAPSGANNDFQDPLPIAVDVGCVDRPSVVLTPVGLMFKSNKGIYLLDRSLQASYIGAQVEGYNSLSVLSAQLIPDTTQVRFLLSSGIYLVFDYFYKKWATWSPPTGGVSDCIFQGQHTYVTSAGQVYQETPGIYIDGTSTNILMNFTTAWIKLAGLQGYQRSYFFYLLASYISSHQLQLQISYDFASSSSQTTTITPDSSNSVENWRVWLSTQRCQAIQIALQEVNTGTPGQGFSMSGLNLIVGMKGKFQPFPAAQSAG